MSAHGGQINCWLFLDENKHLLGFGLGSIIHFTKTLSPKKHKS